MLNMWPVLVVGVEIGLILAVIAAALVLYCIAPLFERFAAIKQARRITHRDSDPRS
jgi:hypothetical protein